MLDNHIYNLHLQLVEENKSLWRIKNEYLKDAGACTECQAFWQKMADDKEKHVADLLQALKNHV